MSWLAESLPQEIGPTTLSARMSAVPIKVFRHGNGTKTRLEFLEGKPRHTIERTGAGRFLDNTFQTVEDASNFCDAELREDESAILYITDGELIVKTALNHAFQQAKKYRAARGIDRIGGSWACGMVPGVCGDGYGVKTPVAGERAGGHVGKQEEPSELRELHAVHCRTVS